MHTPAMRNRDVIGKHNVTITASPRILIRGGHVKADTEETRRLLESLRIEPRGSAKGFTRSYMTPGTREHKEFEAATSKKDRSILSALALLRRAQAMKSPAAKDLADAASLLLDWRPPEWAQGRIIRTGEAISPLAQREGAAFWYRTLMTQGMKGARIVMARAKGGFAPAVLCPDIRTGAYVFAAYRGVEVCAACQELFAPDPERGGKYCSEACGQNFRQKLYRLKVKARTKKSTISNRKRKR
jgi:hypothetical protein